MSRASRSACRAPCKRTFTSHESWQSYIRPISQIRQCIGQYPTMQHCVTVVTVTQCCIVGYCPMHYRICEIYAHIHISVTKWCIVGY